LFAGLVKFLPDASATKNKRKSRKVQSMPSFVQTIRRSLQESVDDLKNVNWAVYWDVFLYKLVFSLCLGMYFSNYSMFLKTKHAVAPKYLGYIIAFQGGIGSICTYFIGHINRCYKNDTDASKRTLHMFIAMTFSLVAMGLAPNIYFYVLFVIPLAVSGAVGRVSGLEMIVNKGDDKHRGSVIGAVSSVRSLSGVVTPILAGVVSEYIGVNYVIFFAAVFSTIGIIVSYIIRSHSALSIKSKKD
jgi:MFS family permease